MNKEILDKFVIEMTEVLKNAKDFGVAQMPDILKQILNYSFWFDVYILVLGALLFGIGFVGMVFAFVKLKDTDYGERCMLIIFASVVASFVGLLMVFWTVPELFQIVIAPKVFLINYFVHLGK